MDSADWFLVGFAVGVFVGLALGLALTQLVKPSASSVIFERDEEGRITGIQYVPYRG